MTTLIGDYLGKCTGSVSSSSRGLQDRTIAPTLRAGHQVRLRNFPENASRMLRQSSHIAWVTCLTQASVTTSFPLTQRSQGTPRKREERVLSVLRGLRVRLKQRAHIIRPAVNTPGKDSHMKRSGCSSFRFYFRRIDVH